MKTSELKELILVFGKNKARKALNWFEATIPTKFKGKVPLLDYCLFL